MKVQYHSNSFIFGESLAVVTAGIFICTLCFHLIQQYSFMSFPSQLFCIFLRTLIFFVALLYAPCCTDHAFNDLCTVFYGDVE